MASIGLKAGRAPGEQTPVALGERATETVRLNVDIDRDLHKKLKMRALESNRTVADIVREMLAAEVAKS